MKRQAIKDFSDIFKIPISDFPDGQITFQVFNDVIDEYEIDYNEFECCRPMLIAMTCITPINDSEERESILAAVNYNPNIESYILDHFTDETEQFYVCEKQFWEQWQSSVGFQDGEAFGLRVEHKNLIENLLILESKHKNRLKEHCQYLSDFVILPKYVFRPLSKWYGCDVVITREVITYKSQLRQSQRSGVQLHKQDSLRSSYSKNFMVSGQKFSSKRPDVLDDDYICIKGDLCYELEISPKVIYLTNVDPNNGELQFNKLVSQGKIDYQYLKRVLKQDDLPVQEIKLSRKTTFDQLLQQTARLQKKNPKKGRLIVDGVVISGVKLFQSFEDYKLNTGALIHYEFLNDSNEWPSDKNPLQSTTPQLNDSLKSQSKVRKTAGLQNLGNTCYMNSAIQVIANLSQIYEYFVETKQYKDQINTKAAMGFKGILAMGFGNLMNQLWTCNAESLQPKLFKLALGTCNEQFESYEQQDSQEYLSFMIDSLHEELNLRLKKPYIVNPDSKGRQIVQLGLENWSNSLRREWSVIFFLFYGQLKSNITCKQCQTDSTTFDIFSNIPVPLPEPTQQTISIIVYRLPNKIKDILNSKITKDAEGTYSLPSFNQDEELTHMSSFGRGVVGSARNSGMLRSKQNSQQTQFTESYNYLTNDQPIRLHIKVEVDIQYKQVIQKIISIKDTNLDPTQTKSQVILFSINPKTKFVKQIFNPEDKLTELDLIYSEIHCQEVLTRKGRDCIRNYYKKNPQFLEQYPESRLKTLIFPSAKDELEVIQGTDQGEGLPLISKAKQKIIIDPESQKYNRSESIQQNSLLGKQIDTLLICYHRRFVNKDNSFQQNYMPQLLAMPFLIKIPSQPSGRRLYDEVWTMASILVKLNSKLQRPSQRWWERKDWNNNVKQHIFKPFVLKLVQRNGLSCSQCHWLRACAGCIIEPTDVPNFIEDLGSDSTIVIEWHSDTLTESYNPMVSEVVEHSSVGQEIEDASIINYTSLEDCLQKFHKPETLENEMRCNKCNDLTSHIKKLEIFRPPPVLIIQLKRFRQVGTVWRKVQTSVDFPVRNLDISQFITDIEYLQNQGIETKYNLHGVVNHFGTLSYGHYTSFVVNPFDNKWYQYDDSDCQQIEESQLSKQSAYMLFYVRKDIQHKSVANIFPKLETSIFLGRPVASKEGKTGFITKIDTSNPQEVEIQFVDQKQGLLMKISELAPESDSSIIKLKEDELKLISRYSNVSESADQEKIQSSNRQNQNNQSTRCCNLFPAATNQDDKQTNVRNLRRFDDKSHLRKLEKVQNGEKPQDKESASINQTGINGHLKHQLDHKKNESSSINKGIDKTVQNQQKIQNEKAEQNDSESIAHSSIDLDHELTDQDMFAVTTIALKDNNPSTLTIDQEKKQNELRKTSLKKVQTGPKVKQQ